MPTTYSTSLRTSLIGTGELAGTWGTVTNANIGTLLEQAITGVVDIVMVDANYTLTALNAASDESRNAVLRVTSSVPLTATRQIIIPNVDKVYLVINTTTGSQAIRVQTATPTSYVDIPNGYAACVYCDGSAVVAQATAFYNPATNGISASVVAATTLTATTLTATTLAATTLTAATLAATTLTAATLTATTLTAAGLLYPTADGTAGQLVKTNGTGTLSFVSASSTVIRSARTANTILAAADQGTLIDITSGTFSQTFTAAATLGSGWFVYLRNAGTGDITLDPNASELIDGLATYVMYQGETRLIQCTGTAFTSLVLSPFYRVFTASGTFTQPPGYTAVGTRVIGASGGGGSGRRGAASNNRGGGSGGGGGALARQIISGLTAGTGYAITIGAGGAVGAAVTVDTTSGNDGTAGGTSSFATLLYAYGGGGGAGGAAGSNGAGGGGGTGSAGTTAGNLGNPQQTADMTTGSGPRNAVGGGGASVVGNGDSGNAEYGGGSGGRNNGGVVFNAGGSSLYGGPGGGSGGTLSNSNVVTVGAAGGAVNSYTPGGGGAGGAATGANGTAGAAGANGFCGTGGGGGGSGTGVGGTGGAGGAPGGGGGGGAASVNSFNSGAGGAGARGEIQVWGVA